MGKHLSEDFSVSDVFPPAAHLPEGIPDDLLNSKYGGVGGKHYKQVVDEIERQLSKTPFLQ